MGCKFPLVSRAMKGDSVKIEEELEKWLSSEEHLLFLQRTGDQFPASIIWHITIAVSLAPED